MGLLSGMRHPSVEKETGLSTRLTLSEKQTFTEGEGYQVFQNNKLVGRIYQPPKDYAPATADYWVAEDLLHDRRTEWKIRSIREAEQVLAASLKTEELNSEGRLA